MELFKFKLNKYRIVEENKLFYPEERFLLIFWRRYYHSVMGVELYFDNLEDAKEYICSLSKNENAKRVKIIHNI